MTISDFLRLPNFSDLRLLAGHGGLQRKLSNVTVADTPDDANWLTGGEFVITTACMLRNREGDLLDFLQTLHLHKAAGLGIKENRYISQQSLLLAQANTIHREFLSLAINNSVPEILLAPIMDSPEAGGLCTQYIQPLEDYDRQYRGELLPTLQAILQCGWNLKGAAARLYIHYNSIKYRYAKICKVLDLSDHDNRSLVEIAMKLYLLSRHKPLQTT